MEQETVPAVINEICAEIAKGQSIYMVCEENPTFPCVNAIFDMRENKDISLKLDSAFRDSVSARLDQAMAMVESLKAPEQTGKEKVSYESTRLSLDLLKWIVAESQKLLGQYENFDAVSNFKPITIIDDLKELDIITPIAEAVKTEVVQKKQRNK